MNDVSGPSRVELLQYYMTALSSMQPPLEAISLGGSSSDGTYDEASDLDFFLLFPDEVFFTAATNFERNLTHPTPVIVSRRRGFVPLFGFGYSYIYQNHTSVDFFLNCPSSLTVSPMVSKAHILVDHTGRYTRFIESTTAGVDRDWLVRYISSELVFIVTTMEKFAKRGDLLRLLHRLERLRLLLLSLEWFLKRGKIVHPHDADLSVDRDLSPVFCSEVYSTIGVQSGSAAAEAIQLLCIAIKTRLVRLDPDSSDDQLYKLVDHAVHSIRQSFEQEPD